MQLETKFLRLLKPVKLGEHIDGWRVCWLGGWSRSRMFYIVMVVRERGADRWMKAKPHASVGRDPARAAFPMIGHYRRGLAVIGFEAIHSALYVLDPL